MTPIPPLTPPIPPLWHQDKVVLWDERTGGFELVSQDELGEDTPVTDVSVCRVVGSSDKPKNQLLVGDNYWALRWLIQKKPLELFQLAYLDPPYNTRTSLKSYHDSLDHQTWLTMLANRLTLVHQLLRPTGVLALHLNKAELGYAQVLCDQLFGRPNFLTLVTWERSQRTLLGQGGQAIVDTSEYILFYARDKTQVMLWPVERVEPLQDKTYRQYNKTLMLGEEKELVAVLEEGTDRPIEVWQYPNACLETINLSNLAERREEIRSFYLKHYERVVRKSNQQKESSLQQRIIQSFPDPKGFYSVHYTPDRGKSAGQKIVKYYHGPDVILFLRDYTEEKDGQLGKKADMNTFWSRAEIPVTGIAGEGRVKLKRGKKPERLLRRILQLTTEPGDGVLDVFGGSGTTGAVAHKMNRWWVMAELPTHAALTEERLTNVVMGDDQDKQAYGGGFLIREVRSDCPL